MLVEPVHDSRPDQRILPQRQTLAVIEQRVDQSPVPVPARRVNYDARGLVQHQDVFVLVDDVQVHLLGLDGHLRLRLERRADLVAGLDAVARLGGPVVDQHLAIVDELRRPGPGDPEAGLDQVLVQPLAPEPLRCGPLETLRDEGLGFRHQTI